MSRSTQEGKPCANLSTVSDAVAMPSALKVRVQGLLAPELAKEVQDRAVEGRRPVSREVEYLIMAGLKAVKSHTD
jgi:hypothetical protein